MELQDIRIILSEISFEGDWKKVLPVGTFHCAKYGKLEITKEMCDSMVQHYNEKVMGEYLSFIDIDHFTGDSCGWITALKAEE
jgi:hypothetical protein